MPTTPRCAALFRPPRLTRWGLGQSVDAYLWQAIHTHSSYRFAACSETFGEMSPGPPATRIVTNHVSRITGLDRWAVKLFASGISLATAISSNSFACWGDRLTEFVISSVNSANSPNSPPRSICNSNVKSFAASRIAWPIISRDWEMIGHAIRDAAKLFTLELQIDRGGEFGEFAELTDEITNSVRRSPQQAKELLDIDRKSTRLN